MKRVNKAVCLIGLSILLGACANVQEKDEKSQAERLAEKGYEIEKAVDSIANYQINGWNYLDPHGIILSGGVNRRYLVTLLRRCDDLRWTEILATTSTINQLTSFDKVLARSPGGGLPKRCPIDKLYLLKAVEKAS